MSHALTPHIEPSFASSDFLSGLVERYGRPDAQTARNVIEALGHTTASDLPVLKARFALGWSYLALSQSCTFDKLGRLQSEFADRAVHLALCEAWRAEKLPGDPVGVFILGLGKLGGHDLNFSSDIDLIAYYDPETIPIPESKGQAYILDRVMKRLTKCLMPPNDPAFIYRVDWRLRPEASVTGLAMSTARAIDFYFFRALPWHRLALLKARVIAGDKATGETFLSELDPFVWRQNLDFRTLDELAALKSRINLEHPRLKQERRQRQPILDKPFGFNVKLGAGGIREVEFIANAQQLIWGGKHYSLRTTHTLSALSELAAEGHMTCEDAEALSHAYRHHRRLENALQMLRNGHEHVLPEGEPGWNDIAALLGDDVGRLLSRTTEHRHSVNTCFDAMFAKDETPQTEPVQMPVFSEAAQARVDDWMSGFRSHGMRLARRTKLEPLGVALAQRVAQTESPDIAVERVDTFLSRLSRSEQYLSLLAANPALLDALIDPLVFSPHMSVLLEQSPHIIDTFLDPSPPSAAFVLAEEDYETRLERLRRFVNEGLFQNYHRFLNGIQDWRGLADGLTKLAETAIETALTIARDDLNAPDLAISVLGLGKLGQGLMAPQSDLDLVFLFEDGVDRELASKAVRRLRTIMSAPLREGIAYELDMRLRPSGRSGPPAVTLSAFRKHHADMAKTWEHIALVPARVVAGSSELGHRVEDQLRNILRRPRDPDQLIADVHHMWGKIRDERIRDVPSDRFDSKLRTGGLMMADFWGAVRRLMGDDDLQKERDQWTEILYWERLLGLTGANLESIPDRYAAFLPKGLEKKQVDLQTQVQDAVPQPRYEPTHSTMAPIRWL